MHDLHEADKILKTVLDYAKENNLNKITEIVVELGSVMEHGEEILPANLAFNIKMLAENTIAKDLEIKIKKIQDDSWILKEIEGE